MQARHQLAREAVISVNFSAAEITAISPAARAAIEELVATAADKFNPLASPIAEEVGVLATFESPSSALSCGIAILQNLAVVAQAPLFADRPPQLWIGIAYGEVLIPEDDKRGGSAVEVARRLAEISLQDISMSAKSSPTSLLGGPGLGRILVSFDVCEALRETYSFDYLGMSRASDANGARAVYAVSWRATDWIELFGYPRPSGDYPSRRPRTAPADASAPTPLGAESITRLIFDADKRRHFAADVLPVPDSPPFSHEGVILLKPGGTFFRPCVQEIVQRILAHCHLRQVRVFDGAFISERELFDKQYGPSAAIASGKLPLSPDDYANIRHIYDNEAFHDTFGVRYADSLVTPALTLCREAGLSESKLTELWDAGRSEKLFHTHRHDGLNKIGFQKSVIPVRVATPAGEIVRIVVNGFIPEYKKLFTKASARVVAFHVMTNAPWSYVRDSLVGGDSNPVKCKHGSIRKDAADHLIRLDPSDSLVNGQRNVCHSSATLIDGVHELDIWFSLPPERTLIGRRCQDANIPPEVLSHFIAENLTKISWTRDDAMGKLVQEVLRTRLKDELRVTVARPTWIGKYAASSGLRPEQISKPFRNFIENGVRLGVAGPQYFKLVCAQCIPALEERLLYEEVTTEIDERIHAMPVAPRTPVIAEAYRIAASDLRFLASPAFQHAVAKPRLIKAHIVDQLPQAALDCAMRTEVNFQKDALRPNGTRPPVPSSPALPISEHPAWADFVRTACPPQRVHGGTAGIILCGGRSTRMASALPKPCLPVGARLMLDATADTLREAGLDGADIFAAVGYRSELVRKIFAPAFRFLEFGPTLGLGFRVATALWTLSDFDELVVLTYVDMPAISPGAIRQLINLVGRNPRRFGMLVSNEASGLSGHVVTDEAGTILRVEQERTARGVPIDQARDAGVYVFHNTEALRSAVLKIQNNNNRHEYIFADVIEILARAGYEIVTHEERPENAKGINTAAELLRLVAQVGTHYPPDLSEIKAKLDAAYRLTLDDGLDSGLLETAIDTHHGPFYFFHWWEKAWS